MPPSVQAWLDQFSIDLGSVVHCVDNGIVSIPTYVQGWGYRFTGDELADAIAYWKSQNNVGGLVGGIIGQSYNLNAAPVLNVTGASTFTMDPNSSLNPWGHDPMNVVAEAPVDHLMEHIKVGPDHELLEIRAESWPDTIRMDYTFLRNVKDGDVGMIAGKPVAYIIRDKKLVFDYTNGYAEYVLGDEDTARNSSQFHRIYLREKQ